MEERINKLFKGDRIIWGIIMVLTIYSLLAVYSSIGTLAYRNMGGNIGYYIIRHAIILGIGLFMIFLTHLIPYRFFSRLSQFFLYFSIPLLLLTLIIGTNLNQAPRWLTLPVIGLTIQPSDFAKLALIMYLARMLSLRQSGIRSFKEAFKPLILPIILICVLILPANLSTSLIVFATAIILLFIGRVPMKFLLAFAGIGVLALALFIGGASLLNKTGRIGTWENRIKNFVQEDSKESYQVEQAKIAVSTGKFFGKKPGKSTQRNFLPHPYSDFIFAIIIEEYGLFLGAIPLILAYMILIYRAGLMVQKANRTFPAFLAIGLALLITFQAFVNMAVAVSLFPVTGQTLPFVSMGGSSMLFTSVAFGMILSVSRGIEKDYENEQQATA